MIMLYVQQSVFIMPKSDQFILKVDTLKDSLHFLSLQICNQVRFLTRNLHMRKENFLFYLLKSFSICN